MTGALAASVIKGIEYPEYVGQSTSYSAGGGGTLAWPSHAVGDIGILLVITQDEALSTPSGWTSIYTPTGTGGLSGGAARLYAFWARATSTAMSAATIADPGNETQQAILTFRKCVSTGTPLEAVTATLSTSLTTAGSFAGGTTLGAKRLVVIASAAGDSDATSSGWANAALASINERLDNTSTQYVLAAVTGQKAAAGAIGTTTATFIDSTRYEAVSFALIPA